VRIALTGTHPGELAARLEALGHEVALCPRVQIEPLGPEEIDVSGYDWVIVTSRNGARELARRMRGKPARLAAIGPGTAEELPRTPDLVPAVATQEGLLAELPRPAGRVLFASAEGARRLLVDELGADFVPLYRTKELRPAAGFRDTDLVVLASPSAARAYAAVGAPAPAVSIGPQTTAAAEEVEVIAEAKTHDLEGLVEAVTRACA
jgi:uroporphyrinogen-III synthase